MPGSDGLLLEVNGQIVPNYDATFTSFKEGEVVSGHVVRIDKDEILVDIGYKSEGVIPSHELSIRKNVDPHDEVEMGEEVDALVLIKEDQDGRLIMSKKRARFEKAWRRIEAAAESGEPVEGHVIEVVKGGLIIDLGVRGFLPASLVDIRRVANLDEFLHTMIECKVIELNRSRNNVVLSRRAVLEEERKEQRQEILDRLQPGLVVEGQISNIVDFGAFVDLNGIDGLIHISELSWSHVNHPSEILNIGDTVQVKVLDIDRDRQRISLGLKQTQADPWQRVVDTYRIGDDLEGKVTKVVTFGAFVEILDGVEGLVHISELASHHVENPREIVAPGDEIKVKILEIDSERRRLSLSVKRVEGQILSAHVGEIVGPDDLDDVPELGLSDDVFPEAPAPTIAAQDAELTAEGEAVAQAEAAADEAAIGAVVEADVQLTEIEAPAEAEAEVAEPRQRRSRGPRRGAGSRGPAEEPAAEAPAEEPAARGSRRARAVPDTAAAQAAAAARLPDMTTEPRIPFVGLTGGLGSGKSTALAALERLGAATLSTDAVVHELYASDEVRDAVVARWGAEVAPGGVVDRAAIARHAFADPAERAWLEGLLWPLVGARVIAFREAGRGRRAAPARRRRRDAAAVRGRAWTPRTTRRSPSSPTSEIRSARAADRGHEAVDERAARQLTQDEKAARATYVVRNDGSVEDLQSDLTVILSRLRR